MSTTVSEYTQAAQEQTLKALRHSQDAVVETIRVWAKTIERAIPETPAVPVAAELPTPQELVATSFGFAEQLLKAQHEFTDKVLAAAEPVLPKSESKAPKATSGKTA
jgi:hypothetical protein